MERYAVQPIRLAANKKRGPEGPRQCAVACFVTLYLDAWYSAISFF